MCVRSLGPARLVGATPHRQDRQAAVSTACVAINKGGLPLLRSRFNPPGADGRTGTDPSGPGFHSTPEEGAPPQRTSWRGGPEEQDGLSLPESAPPGVWLHPTGPRLCVLPEGEGTVHLQAARRQTPQPRLQAPRGPPGTFLPNSDSGLDGPAHSEAGAGCPGAAGAGQRELCRRGGWGRERVQRGRHAAVDEDAGTSQVFWGCAVMSSHHFGGTAFRICRQFQAPVFISDQYLNF